MTAGTGHADDGGARRPDLGARGRRADPRLQRGDRTDPRRRLTEEGSAVVDFLLVSLLLTVLVLGVVQLALALHVRTMLTDAAAEGARYAALHGSDLDAGRERTAELIAMTLPDSYAQSIDAAYDTYDDVSLVTMTVSAPLPVLGLLGPGGTIVVTGRAVDE